MVLGAMLFVKHLLADGPLQTDYQVANKGRFLHVGGLAHAGTHILGTAICFVAWQFLCAPATAAIVLIGVLAAEFVLHYAIDYAKCRVDREGNWSEAQVGPDGRRVLVIRDKMFFTVFLADQMAHSLTYVAMLYVLARV